MTAIPDLDRFDADTAWRVGRAVVERCRDERLPVVVVIQLGEQTVFQCGMPGSTAMNEAWARRKAAVVRHFDLPSLEVFERYAEGRKDFYEAFALDRRRMAASGGAVPIRVRGTRVGVIAVSGLDADGDHALALDALIRLQNESEGRP